MIQPIQGRDMDEAYLLARRRILNNVVRRRQKSFSFNGEGLTEIPDEIALCSTLRELSLMGNRLTEIPSSIGALKQLEILRLTGNQIKTISVDFQKLENLRYLYLDRNGISSLPDLFYKMRYLTVVDLERNNLRSLPKSIIAAPGLREIRFEDNRLSSLPSFTSRRLQQIRAARNSIASIETDFRLLPDLQILDLSENLITDLPEDWSSLIDLRLLQLNQNHLTTLPRSIGELDSLEKNVRFYGGISIRDNPLLPPLDEFSSKSQPDQTVSILTFLRSLPPLGSDELTNVVDNLPEIPTQVAGPHFEIAEDGRLTFAAPEALDDTGNNLKRLRDLHPYLRELARELVDNLKQGNNPHWQLKNRAESYFKILDRDLADLNFSVLYAEGVRLSNAEQASILQIEQGDLPPLNGGVFETLKSLLQIHGSFVLATREGMSLIAAEERYGRRVEEELEYRESIRDFAAKLKDHPDVVEPRVAEFVADVANEIGQGTNPERGAVVATGTVHNMVITIASGATIAGMSAIAIATQSPLAIIGAQTASFLLAESIKKSRPFSEITKILASRIDRINETGVYKNIVIQGRKLQPYRRLVVNAEPQLRRLAKLPGMQWLVDSIGWLKQIDKDRKQ